MHSPKIRLAVRAILDACFAAGDPVACLHAEVARLTASGEWSEQELGDLYVMVLEEVQRIGGQG
jgi:hypothetical protein